MQANLCFLMLTPLSIPIATGEQQPSPYQKDSPYFFEIDIEVAAIGEVQLTLEGVVVHIRRQILDGHIWLAECRYQLPNIFDEASLAQNHRLQQRLKAELQRLSGYTGAFTETYTVLLFGRLDAPPDDFLNNHASLLVRWVRGLDITLTAAQSREALAARARYSEMDLTVVDWDGAVIIAEKEDFQFDIELFKIGNYQLLRYRLLDRTLEKSLEQLRRYADHPRPPWLPSRYKKLREIVSQRLALVLDFEKADQSLLLIGDWYSARVYRLVVDQYHLPHWKAIVQAKIDSLAAINEIVYQELAFSWGRLLDWVQFIGWLLLLIGYIALFLADL